MTQQNETTRLKINLGALHLEYEGRDDFLKTEVPALIRTMDKLQVSKLVIPMDSLQLTIDDARALQGDVDDELARMKHDLDSLSEMGEMESLRLQMAMDRMSKMMSTLSNLLKKISDTAAGITQNLK
jgi:hypothetical protein